MPSTIDLLASSDLSEHSARKLFVPTDDTFVDYHKNQTTGGAVKDKKIRDDLAIRAWRYIGGGKTITSETMIPAGVLIMLYNSVHQPKTISQPIDKHPISLSMEKLTGQKIQSPSDLVPMACALGSDILHAVISKR